MTSYLLKKLSPEERSQAEKRFLDKNGVGISQYMHLLEEMSQDLIRLPKSQLESA